MNFVLIKLKQNNSRDLKDVLHAQETFCRYFRHTKRTHKNNSNKKKLTKTKNKKYPTTKTKYKKTKIKNQTKQQNIEKKKNKGNKETCK